MGGGGEGGGRAPFRIFEDHIAIFKPYATSKKELFVTAKVNS